MAKKNFNFGQFLGEESSQPAVRPAPIQQPDASEKSETTKETRTTVVLPADLFKRARVAAMDITAENGKFYSLKDLFREALESYLDQIGK